MSSRPVALVRLTGACKWLGDTGGGDRAGTHAGEGLRQAKGGCYVVGTWKLE